MKALIALMAATLLQCSFIGMVMPVLPLFIDKKLHYGTAVAGAVNSLQFIVMLFSRFCAGRISDSNGPHYAMGFGAFSAAAAGIFYIFACFFTKLPSVSIVFLVAGCGLQGWAQSMLVTGAVAGGVDVTDQEKKKDVATAKGQKRKGKKPKPAQGAGSAIGWIGLCVFGGLILGAPAGTFLYQKVNFLVIGALLGVFSAILGIWCFKSSFLGRIFSQEEELEEQDQIVEKKSLSSKEVLKIVWFPGLCFGFCAVAHGLVMTYGSLLFSEHHWAPLWFSFAFFGGGLMISRVTLGYLPDVWGGEKTAILSSVLEVIGFLLIGFFPCKTCVLLGIFLLGFGFSFAFPAFALLCLSEKHAKSKGILIGVCNAVGDGIRGGGILFLGMLSTHFGFKGVFLAGGLVAVFGGVGAVMMHKRSRKQDVIKEETALL
ncbi:MFS transporter [Acetobacteraceae bacterium]|nr:MFS transporter [Acetobacteraceae bacterium]